MRELVALLVIALVGLVGLPGDAPAQEALSPYAGEETRDLKALSPEEVEALLTGRGAGFARAAELNHYPGPAHVLDHADRLGLTDEQLAATRAVQERMRREAVRLGRALVERERALDRLFAEARADERRLRAIALEIGALQGGLRAAHLAAHVEMRRILSPAQIERYDELRGYASQDADRAGGHRHP